ncbi:serine hydrolase [Streptomyces sp. XD-27]|uniref:serine hydrolase n=1 Tax=Streptomyces sp. XD-27 TaxID=3062779 RepID=UPI0026F41B27|nr:serine hydrolase [Streptomyces sp. XD-27]WKX74186.1 serine hydrolase [Streptomyces sp. XD-27]
MHAACVDCGRQTGLRADEPVVLASVVKVPLVLEFARQVAHGQLDPAERAVVRRADRLGGTGTAGCLDDVEMSLRDLAGFALSVSDNSAADVLFERVGVDTVRLLVRELGLSRTRIVGSPRALLRSMMEDVGAADPAAFAAVYPALSPARLRALRVRDPRHTNGSTAREMTRLLSLVWTDRAGPPGACAQVRALMAHQVSWHRLAAAFPEDVAVAAKTGTLLGVRNEIGVVTYPDGGRYAVSVFTETADLRDRRPDLDAAIGTAGRAAVEALRGCCGPAPHRPR